MTIESYNIIANYRFVIFGVVPHSSGGKFDSSSVIAKMKKIRKDFLW